MFNCFHAGIVSQDIRRAVMRSLRHIVVAAGFFPVFILGPMGNGTILLHDHNDEPLHAHKVAYNTDRPSCPVISSGHEHSSESTHDRDGTHFVLSLPNLPRLSGSASSSGLQLEPAPPQAFARQTIASCPQQIPICASMRASDLIGTPLRAHDTLTNLLLGSNSLLI